MNRQFIIWLVLLLACGIAQAEELSVPPVADWSTPLGIPCMQPKSDAPLTLFDVVDQSLCHFPQTRETWANAKAAAAQVGINRADYFPNINLSTSASHQSARGAGVDSNASTQSLGLSVDYLLFDFGGREGRVESAKQALIAADWTHDSTLQSVMFTAIQNYYQLFAARATVAAQIENEKSALQNLEAAKSRYEAGVATSADRLQAQTAYSQAQLTRMRAEGDAQIAQGNLANIMGLDADTVLNIVAPVAQPSDEQQKNVRSLMETAKRERPDLAAAEAQVKAAEANIRAARSGGLPTVSIGANQNFNHSNLSDQPHTTSISLALNVPLFTGFRNTYQVKQAQAQAEARIAERDRIENQITFDVWKAYYNLDTEQQAFKAAVDLIESARESLRVALGRYKAGVGTLIDLLTAQAAMANANSQYIQAAYNWHIARAALAQAIGSLHIQNLENIIPNISENPAQK